MDQARLHWAACRRGILELDILFGRYLKNQYPQASAADQHSFEELLKQHDQTLFDWLIKRETIDQPEFVGIVKKILN